MALSFKSMSKNILLIVLLLSFLQSVSYGQVTGRLEGKVVDTETKEPLPGVNIILEGTVLGTSTGPDGHFKLNHIPPGTYRVIASMIGYQKLTQKNITIRANQTTTLNIKLKQKAIETPELVVTATKRRQSILDTPNSIGVLTNKDFKRKNETYLDKLLEYASGVNFMGSQINIRGSSGFNYGAGSRVLLLVDGVPVMPGDSGDIKWDLLPASQIERVEIVKGAGSALYGSSALGGVINIITKEASLRPKTNIRFSAGAYDKPRFPEWQWTDRLLHYDDFDIDHSRRIGKNQIFLAYGRHQSTGYAQNGHYLRMNGTVKVVRQLTSQQKLTFSGNYETGTRGAGLMWRSQRHALEVSPEAIGDYVISNKLSTNMFHQWAYSKTLGLKTRFSFFRNYWKNYFHDNVTASTAHRYGLEVQADYQFTQSNSLVFGTEESWDHVTSDLVGQHDQYVISAYVQNEHKFSNIFLMTLGFRYDYQHVDVGFEDSELSPKLGLVWHAQPFITFRASSGRGFRAASMSERFSDSIYSGLRIVPNINLHSETAWSHEIGLNFHPGSKLYLDVAGFLSDYWDLIEPEPDETQTIQFINVTRARISGMEINLKTNPWLEGFFINIGYTFMNPRNLENGDVLAYRAKHLFTGSANYTLGKFDFGFDYRYVSRLEKVKVYPQDDRVPQKVADAHVTYRQGPWQISANAFNIFNHNHTQIERTLLPIRHYALTLLASF